MEEMVEKPGFFERLVGVVHKHDEEFEEEIDETPTRTPRFIATGLQHITVRRQVVSFDDAVAAADGLKRGETQILNLVMTKPEMREKIKNFLDGVRHTAEGCWEELGEHVYLLAPTTAYVEVAPPSARMEADYS